MSRGDYGLDFKRTYNAKSLEKSIFGYGWTATGLENLFIKGNQNMIDYTNEDGTTHTFSFDATDGFVGYQFKEINGWLSRFMLLPLNRGWG
ncbi:DUF6531 domain-containing protein [Lysinibacillus boronitolerans]|uniref:DUF6531 domain-containing protein n=1 Tax=Lysinibacillus boronitolerans TaxID=309788 RepID=UPI00216276FD|nr:DUF6531 domain-containing protein [Lysinibacillus boronitolerans]MCS1393286.1 DUF6531 domain-containing protein [Lysinibacillus boronitolerans]